MFVRHAPGREGVVLPVGLQPTAYRLGGGRSMHLSYGSVAFENLADGSRYSPADTTIDT